ncbi:CTLH/CRA C-terminal to lish motif domain-containing protein [Neurospora tetraspora]|uniref:GID complex catalytic subunit 2 n=1 Tax=Neurospora tetraspora TaxID=94610 RepID=A0AAE0MWN5_9PEZI|nr:CTLH/CRA C-terminal to lish motif domain-containing protein [Neurospora tetraspora]
MTAQATAMEALQKELDRLNRTPGLSATIDKVDKIIEMLTSVKDQIVQSGMDTHVASMSITRTQNPIKSTFEKINDDLKGVTATQRKLGKMLDKHFPLKDLPSEHDAMADQEPLINRAISMHLLREGQFSVASTFIEETGDAATLDNVNAVIEGQDQANASDNYDDEPMDEDRDDDDDDEDEYMSPLEGVASLGFRQLQNLSSLQSHELEAKFSQMYTILQDIKSRNLLSAIEWARSNSVELEARGSNLEFELSRLQYVWLFKGPSVNGLPDNELNGTAGALLYAQQNFWRFGNRYIGEIQQLANAQIYARNLSESPYRHIFSTETAFADVASSFTREFCSLLGLSAESPLYIAVTAGALALPLLIKYQQATRAKGTEWTTTNELAFETPLPERMLYHSIFVCPVSKEQTTEQNPPMMIPCGHVLAKETLQRLLKGTRFKCPYCPAEGLEKDARRIMI